MSKKVLSDLELFIERFKPDMDRGGNSIQLYDTTGSDLDYVKTIAGAKPYTVWTLVDGGDYCVITPGICWANRMNYVICEVPYVVNHEDTRDYDF